MTMYLFVYKAHLKLGWSGLQGWKSEAVRLLLNCEPQLELMIRRRKNQSWPSLGAELVQEGRGHPRKMDAPKMKDERC